MASNSGSGQLPYWMSANPGLGTQASAHIDPSRISKTSLKENLDIKSRHSLSVKERDLAEKIRTAHKELEPSYDHAGFDERMWFIRQLEQNLRDVKRCTIQLGSSADGGMFCGKGDSVEGALINFLENLEEKLRDKLAG